MIRLGARHQRDERPPSTSISILTCTRRRVYNFIHTGCMDDEKQIRCFPKKTQVTSRQDKTIAAARYRAVAGARKEKK